MSRVWYVISALALAAVCVNAAPKPQEPSTPEIPEMPQMPEAPETPQLPSEFIPSSPTPPLANGELAVPDCKNTTDVYDMSQNGSENYKVNVKGFTFLLAGSDTVLGAAMLMSGLADDKNNPTLPQHPSDKISRLMDIVKKMNKGGRSINVNLVDNQEGDKQTKRFLRNIH